MHSAARKALSCTIGRLLANMEILSQATAPGQELKKALVFQGTNTINTLSA